MTQLPRDSFFARLMALFFGARVAPTKPVGRNWRFAVKNHQLVERVDDSTDLAPVPFKKTSKHGGAIDGPRFIILHYTAGGTAKSAINTFLNYPVSAHLVVDRDGSVTQMVRFVTKAWHAGKSVARSKWGTRIENLNNYAIGIEMVNWGYDGAHVPEGVDTSGWLVTDHKNERGLKRRWERYPEAQVEAVCDMVHALMDEYGIPIEHVLGHEDIAPRRKTDPGPAFPMAKIKARLGERA